ncbi:16S rRNA (uracil(1498)-N(3))-methyltransferase [Nitrospira sp. Nam80]
MPAYFIQSRDVHDDAITITGDLLHHLRASLRLQLNEPLHLTDERRRRHHAIVTGMTRDRLTARILRSIDGPERLPPRLTLGQALLKGDHMDWIVQKATELGVDTIIPLITHRSVVRPQQARVANQTARWQRIVCEAAQQSEQWQLPTVQAPVKLHEFVTQSRATLRLILVERAGAKRLGDIQCPMEPAASIAVAVGPEGGWQTEEVMMAEEQNFQPITLGGTILRSETASLAALAIIQHRSGALG